MNNSKTSEIILELNRRTKEGEITWESSKMIPNSISGEERIKGLSFSTFINNRHLRIYKFENQYYNPDDDRNYWSVSYRLEFIDDVGNGLYSFSFPSLILDLYNTVVYQNSGVNEFANDFLAEISIKNDKKEDDIQF